MEKDDSGSSIHETGDASSSSGKPERIGDMLRRERERRQISVEAIAAKLRLNAKYIEALEENRFDRLPGDTYIRVYLRSLAQYLSLDSEDIFRRFFDERGVTGADTLRKDSSTKISLPALEDRKRGSPTALVAIFLCIVLAGLVVFAHKHGWLSKHLSKSAVTAADSTSRNTAPVTGAASDTGKGTPGAATAAGESSGSVAQSPRPANDSLTPFAAAGSGPMKLLVSVTLDSCRVRVYSDGKEWRRMMHKGAWATFFAQDSFNVLLSASNAATLTLDGKPLSLKSTDSASALKVARTGITRWTLAKWKSTFH